MTGSIAPLRRLAAWFDAPARPERLALVRMLAAGYAVVWLVIRGPHLRHVTEFTDDRWRPVGVLAWMSGPPSGAIVAVVAASAFMTGVAVALGWRHRWTGPIFALSLLLVTTWRTSWGQIFHTEHLLVLHVIVLAVVPASAAWSLDARRRRRDGGFEVGAARAFGWPVRVMALVTVATYFVAGVAKLRYGGATWLDGDVLVHQVAFDNVRKAAVGSPTSPVAGVLLDIRWLFTPMALASLLVELGAPFALLSARTARAWAGLAWAFHVGIVVVMVIVFAYPVSGIAFAPVLLAHGEGAPLPRFRRAVRDRSARHGLTEVMAPTGARLGRP